MVLHQVGQIVIDKRVEARPSLMDHKLCHQEWREFKFIDFYHPLHFRMKWFYVVCHSQMSVDIAGERGATSSQDSN